VQIGRVSGILKNWFEKQSAVVVHPWFRAQGDGFSLLMPTDSSKSRILAKLLG